MIVFGDRVRAEVAGEKAADLLARLDEIAPAGAARHSDLVAAFVEAAELAQGLLDRRFEAEGCDRLSSEQNLSGRLLGRFAHAIADSWTGGFEPSPIDGLREAATRLAALDPTAEIRCRRAEGFAHYAVYPEAYLEAALRLGAGEIGLVVGIRSIGVALAAMVAAGAGSPPMLSVRPVGHPFRRSVALSEDSLDLSQPGTAAGVAIVDEGPGLSGSSFAAVADALAGRGVGRECLHFFPSHPGEPGDRADPFQLARWRSARRHTVTFDDVALAEPFARNGFASWLAGLVDPIVAIEDLSGGAWRQHLRGSRSCFGPPVAARSERRKLLLTTQRGDRLVARFAGLGPYGEGKLARARALGEAGLAPETAGLRHGFIVQRWYADAAILDADAPDAVETVARYLGFRERHLPAPQAGATLHELAVMLGVNASQALGAEAAAAFASWDDRAAALQDRVRPIATDNRLHRWEWLRTPDGAVLKADALDHCEAHDLVGCQDLAWDVVGALVELGWPVSKHAAFVERVESHAGRRLSQALLAYYRPCYVAFQLGLFTMAAASAAPDGDDGRRLAKEADRYRTLLLESARRA